MRLLAILLLGLPLLSDRPWLSDRPSPPAQAPPATEVYLASLTIAGNGAPMAQDTPQQVAGLSPVSLMGAVKLAVGKPVNISNNPGYDNQPSFLRDNSGVLFTSIRDGQPTDIYRYDIKSKRVSQVTNTPENEYSALVTPDGKTFSVVRGAEQQLWRFDLNGSNPRLVYAHKGLIGYHVWIDATHLALFVLGEQGAPATLQMVDLATGNAEVIDRNIGRSLLMRPGKGTVSYVSKSQAGAWMVNDFNPKTRAITPIVKTPDRSEDCAWMPDGTLVMGQGSGLLTWRPGETGWTLIADLSDSGLTAITRLAVSRDGHWLAIVAQPKPQESNPR